MDSNRRKNNRIRSNLPIEIQIDKQITISGELKDLSPKSAFIKVNNSVYMQVNDEFNFTINTAFNDITDQVRGKARISRIKKGEGIAVFFTQMDENSSNSLKQMLQT